ncbi:MAG: hypothetical protein JW862_04905 [Anaerolineales bacterium]|nr:hypothetical protein [Anaerolineales bacterium]
MLVALLLASGLIIAGCSPVLPDDSPTATAEEHQVQLPAVGAGSEEESELMDRPENGTELSAQGSYPFPTEMQALSSGDETEYPAPVVEAAPTFTPYPEPESSQPEPRTEMTASDLSNFELASGQVQLVEFFAFW